MAVKALTLEPSADIHLVLEPAARAILQLDVLSHDDTFVAPAYRAIVHRATCITCGIG